MSDARRYAVWAEPRSRSFKGSRPSVPHWTNLLYVFFLCVYAFMCYAQCATILGTFHNVYKILACKPTRTASRLLKSEAGDGHFAWALARLACLARIFYHDRKVQKRATKSLPQLKHLKYSERLRACKLPTLHYRRIRGDMIETFKILTGKYDRAAIPVMKGADCSVTRATIWGC